MSYTMPSLTVSSLWGRISGYCTHLYAPKAPGHKPVGADTAQEGVCSYLPKIQPGLQLILVIDILLAAIKTLRGSD